MTAAAPSTIPNRFSASIGGFMGVSYGVKLHDGILTYTMLDTQYRNEQHTPIQPTETDWRKFRRTLDDLNIWQWRSDYPNPGICDGTGWSFDIAYSDHAITTQGDNNYPDANGNPTNEPDATKAFNRFLRAISKLTKRSFE